MPLQRSSAPTHNETSPVDETASSQLLGSKTYGCYRGTLLAGVGISHALSQAIGVHDGAERLSAGVFKGVTAGVGRASGVRQTRFWGSLHPRTPNSNTPEHPRAAYSP